MVIEELLKDMQSACNAYSFAGALNCMELISSVINNAKDFNECLEIAYNEIKDRNGKLINGTFVKEEDL